MDHASPSRSLVKTMTWRLIATTDTFLLTFLAAKWFGSDMGISGGEATTLAATVASLEVVTKMALYYIHERSWARLDWGIEPALQA